MLLPVTLKVQSASGAQEVILGGYVAKSPEYRFVHEDVYRKIVSTLARYSDFVVEQAPRVSFLYYYGRGARKRELAAAVGTSDLNENMLERHPALSSPLMSAFRACSVMHALFTDAGRHFKDPEAKKLAEHSFDTAIQSILKVSII